MRLSTTQLFILILVTIAVTSTVWYLASSTPSPTDPTPVLLPAEEPATTTPIAPEPVEDPPPTASPAHNPPVTNPPPVDPASTATCYVGGCSNQLCTNDPDMASTCEWRAEYACYQTAVCEMQPSGACGWTPSVELNACLANPGNET